MANTIRLNVNQLDGSINVNDLFQKVKLQNAKCYTDSKTTLPIEAGYFLSGIMLGERKEVALQLPYLATLLYYSDHTFNEEDALNAEEVIKDFDNINDGNILNLVKLVNNMNCYYTNQNHKLQKYIKNEIINDVRNVANRIVTFSNENKFINNIYDINDKYIGNVNRFHKLSICEEKIFYCDIITDNTLLELISYYILILKSKTVDLSNIKQLSIFDPINNIEAICNINDIDEELINKIIKNIL